MVLLWGDLLVVASSASLLSQHHLIINMVMHAGKATLHQMVHLPRKQPAVIGQ